MCIIVSHQPVRNLTNEKMYMLGYNVKPRIGVYISCENVMTIDGLRMWKQDHLIKFLDQIARSSALLDHYPSRQWASCVWHEPSLPPLAPKCCSACFDLCQPAWHSAFPQRSHSSIRDPDSKRKKEGEEAQPVWPGNVTTQTSCLFRNMNISDSFASCHVMYPLK